MRVDFVKLNLRNIIRERIYKTIWDFECRNSYHDTKAVMYMNEYTMNLIKEITTRGLRMYAKDIPHKEDDGITGVYEGTDIIIKNELKDFEIEIKEKEN